MNEIRQEGYEADRRNSFVSEENKTDEPFTLFGKVYKPKKK